VTALTGACGRQADLVLHMWKEDLLLSGEFEIPGISVPNFVLFFFFFTLVSYETVKRRVKKHDVDFKKKLKKISKLE